MAKYIRLKDSNGNVASPITDESAVMDSSGRRSFDEVRNAIKKNAEKIKKNAEKIDEIGNAKSVTYSKLKALRDAGKLVAGMQYRITDYQCTVSPTDVAVARHDFDIIVRADSESVLNENARAAKKPDDYTDGSIYLDDGDKCVYTGKVFTFGNGTKAYQWRCYERPSEVAGYYSLLPAEEIAKLPMNELNNTLWCWVKDELDFSAFAGDKFQHIDTYAYNFHPYFEKANLAAWELKYCLDNDTERFTWALANCRGVIYYMKDEWGNECPYDFKNIMFKRKLKNGSLDTTSGTDKWVYTFNAYNMVTSETSDATMLNDYPIKTGGNICKNNVIKEYCYEYNTTPYSALRLNNIVFLNKYKDNVEYYECIGNTFGHNCYDNTLGNSSGFNTFGGDCYSNILRDKCSGNTFGESFHNNTLGTGCHGNVFKRSCSGNTLGGGCTYNLFMNFCNSNTLGDMCVSNQFGNSCYNNVLGQASKYNTFGNYAGNNIAGKMFMHSTLGNHCRYNTFGTDASTALNYVSHCTLENGVSNTIINGKTATAASNYLQNIHILAGVCGTSNADRLTISVAPGLAYQTNVGMRSDGTLAIWNPADVADAAKRIVDITDWDLADGDNLNTEQIQVVNNAAAIINEGVVYVRCVSDALPNYALRSINKGSDEIYVSFIHSCNAEDESLALIYVTQDLKYHTREI